MKIVFFGSFRHYSAQILERLVQDRRTEVVAVVTTPPMPVGRKKVMTKTEVQVLAEERKLPVLAPKKLDQSSLEELEALAGQPDYLVTAGYGKIIPPSWLKFPTKEALNLHFSLLPKFRGANPAEWTLMLDEEKTGVTLIKMANKVDAGPVYAFTEMEIEALETRESLYAKLYDVGAETLPEMLEMVDQGEAEANPQPAESPTPYAALFKREDGFIPWQTIIKAMEGKKLEADDFPNIHFLTALQWLKAEGKLKTGQDFIAFVDRLSRALCGFPGLWTKVMTNKGEKRLKILETSLDQAGRLELLMVQLEGQHPARFNQIKNNLIITQ